MRVMQYLRRRAPLLTALLILVGASPSAATGQITISSWLVLGPMRTAVPFGSVSDSAALDALRPGSNVSWPVAGGAWTLPGGAELRWTRGTAALRRGERAVAAAYIESDRWQRITVDVGTAPHRLWVDGRRVTSPTVDVATGKHLLLLERMGAADDETPTTVTLTSSDPAAKLSSSLDPRHAPTFRELHDVVSVSEIRLDPAGTKAALATHWQDAEADRELSAIEVRDVANGRLLTEVRQGGPRGARWSANGAKLAYLSNGEHPENGSADLLVWDASNGSTTRVLRDEAARSIVGWSPDGQWIYYLGTARTAAPDVPKPGEARRLTEVWQRLDASPLKPQLFAVHTKQGTRFTLVGDSTFGVSAAELSPDGTSIVYTRNAFSADARPWLHAEIWTVDVTTLATVRVFDLTREAFGGPTAFAWSPDGRAIAFCGSAKETVATDTPTFSVYENSLYVTRLDRPALVSLSEGFVPNVGGGLGCTSLRWNARDGRIYVPADVGARTLMARTRRPVTSALETTTLELMTMPGEVMSGGDVAAGSLVAAMETPVAPVTVVRLDLATGAATTVAQPNAKFNLHPDALVMPAWRNWSFKNSRGEDIEAWYWLPAGFDSTRSYPMIVHYYGGTLPMKKNFEQRLIWFAANGYVVLYMNPAGTPGYGQKFADYHINDWGFPAATDIIEGTEQFLASHRYADAARVGNFGHSYGGFMTMHLHTRTKLFRTGIAIAGISNIADYWGAGASGFSYTDGTCPGCYPWNRKDLFVDRSPLFQADRITAPMLLIHGTDDTNVVPTESEQLFTALRMLGREAELVRVKGENHGINSRPSVEYLRDEMLLEWFDKQLRDQPAAWAARWKVTPR